MPCCFSDITKDSPTLRTGVSHHRRKDGAGFLRNVREA